MRKRRPVYLRINIILAVLLFLLLTVNIVRDYRFYFTSIDSAVLVGDTVWGVDLENEKTTVFMVSLDTGIGHFRRFPMAEGGSINTISAPFVSNGQVFFRKILCATDGTLTEQLVFWNVRKNRFEIDRNGGNYAWKSKTDETDSNVILVKSDDSNFEVREADPPEDSEWKKKGKVMLGVRKDGEEKLIDCVHTDTGEMIRSIFIAFLCSVLLFVVLMVLSSLADYYRVYPGAWMRLGILLLIMIMVLIPILGNRLIRYLYAYAGQYIIEHCADATDIRASAIDQELLERFMKEDDPVSSDCTADLWKYSMADTFSNNSQNSTGSTGQTHSKEPEAWNLYDEHVIKEESCIIFKKDENLCIVNEACTDENLWLTDDYTAQRKNINQAFSTGQAVSFITVINNQRYAVSFLPAETSSGTRVLVGTRIGLNNTILQFYRVVRRALRVFIILGGIFLILLGSGLVMALRPVSRLKEAMKEITAGNLKVRVQCQGFNELHYVAQLFNAMADRLEVQSEGTDSYRVFYDSFLPASLLRKMSGRSVSGALYPKAVYRTNACSIVLDAQGDDSSEEKRNKLYANAIQAAEDHGGHPVGFDDKYIRLVCTEGAEAALRAVTNIQQSLLTEKKSFAWAGMATGEVKLCVIGNDGRKNVTEQDSTEAEILSDIARDLKIPVIVTEIVYMAAMRNTAKLHFRCLGRLSKGEYTSDAPLYELLDANDAAAKATRKYSRSAFELGVKAYASGDYFTARNEMIKVLGLDPEDLAARCYILNCDRKEPAKVCQVIK